jgi:nicotinate phosphoribosyltransferase
MTDRIETARRHPRTSALFTDLYELTMLRAYFERGMTDEAVFSLFVRTLPPRRNYLIACGLSDLLADIEALRFTDRDLTFLSSLGKFPTSFLEWLQAFRFTGEVHAVPEGTPIFANEPILEVIAPIAEAQLIETLVLNQIGFQTNLASKAVRVVHAARGRPVVDFGGRRAHGIDAAVKGARAFYVAGISATSNVLAGMVYGIPVAGTVAHSFIEAFPGEMEAFRVFAEIYPETILLVDTYDTLAGVRKVAALARSLAPSFRVQGVRLDSGDLLELSRGARGILDGAGLSHVKVFASGGLDESEIDRLVADGAPIDAFGVGTELSVAADAPALDIAYKLTESGGMGRMKLSTGKRTLPGRKQIFREVEDDTAVRDTIARWNEALPGTPLLSPVMTQGRRVGERVASLADVRSHAVRAAGQLPPRLRSLDPAEPYAVAVSRGLADYERDVRARIAESMARDFA